MYRALILAASLLFATPAWANDMTAGFSLKHKSEDIVQMYIGGVIHALNKYNFFNKLYGNEQLFCPPENAILSGSFAFDVLEDVIQRKPDWKGHDADSVILMGLRDIFPCE